MFAFDYHLLGSTGEEVLNPSLCLASDAIEIQLQQETLLSDIVKGFQDLKKSGGITSVWLFLSISSERSST